MESHTGTDRQIAWFEGSLSQDAAIKKLYPSGRSATLKIIPDGGERPIDATTSAETLVDAIEQRKPSKGERVMARGIVTHGPQGIGVTIESIAFDVHTAGQEER